MRLVNVATLVVLASVLPSCRPNSPKGARPASEESTTQTPQYVGSILNPELFATHSIGRDASGKYIKIDDMLFRVSSSDAFAFQGGQWPNGMLIFDLAPDVRADTAKSSQFVQACALLTAQSGVTCVDVRMNPIGKQNYVYVMSGTVNESAVGKQGGQQNLTIYNWDYPIIIAHEIKHALGWVHEHQRLDRDLYVTINWANINDSNKQADFGTMSGAWEQSPMDFDSIMMYGPTAFALPGTQSITVLPQYQSSATTMGQRNHISSGDYAEVTGVYGKKGTEWCGLIPLPRKQPPQGCFLECYRAIDPTYGAWEMCGSCAGATKCR